MRSPVRSPRDTARLAIVAANHTITSSSSSEARNAALRILALGEAEIERRIVARRIADR